MAVTKFKMIIHEAFGMCTLIPFLLKNGSVAESHINQPENTEKSPPWVSNFEIWLIKNQIDWEGVQT